MVQTDWKIASTLVASIVLALLGYFLTYFHNLRLAQRKDRLERVNAQLSDFYGPLLALSSAGRTAWAAFRSTYQHDQQAFWTSHVELDDPRSPVGDAWRLWVREVFMPLNVRQVEIITTRADLIEEPEMPGCLLDLCAHVEGYRPILEQWTHEDYSMNMSVDSYPREVNDYVSARFKILKEKQATLLGLL